MNRFNEQKAVFAKFENEFQYRHNVECSICNHKGKLLVFTNEEKTVVNFNCEFCGYWHRVVYKDDETDYKKHIPKNGLGLYKIEYQECFSDIDIIIGNLVKESNNICHSNTIKEVEETVKNTKYIKDAYYTKKNENGKWIKVDLKHLIDKNNVEK